ncbi:MAG: hypothetical protein AXW14_08615 [Alteromonas sp. Nap_26]|nr:MAG: hypothetical protein AXW14_08615 [Alteromonas sp. Nap_26]
MITTNQILQAPYGAIFVCTLRSRNYVRQLLEELGRTDLKLRTLGQVFSYNNWRGTRVPIVIDHHCYEVATIQQMEEIHDYQFWQASKER